MVPGAGQAGTRDAEAEGELIMGSYPSADLLYGIDLGMEEEV